MKTYGEVDIQILIFLTSALVRGDWSASRSGRLTPGKEHPVPIVIFYMGMWNVAYYINETIYDSLFVSFGGTR
jgi:hypothetical protein